ncbi:DUF551 domain-containing protein [Klebsiella pneumoniae]|uniref:DUF551 domain-containing protein n=1 Tax=Klebsiella pneumoniae TaxID=573 RepID=UPI00236CA022|nr:DUF551 domain-containing protein [Klebsiella pneumoniae]MCI8066408.1 DUF551 domain-containing protein [Klebsiella pneumoniae]HDK6770128.1 DUF551 domain-containing protein [Klebsiella pneumoniae]
MTKSTITRERIELIANFHRAMTLPPSHDEIEELARMALAAMDSEPVAEVYQVPNVGICAALGPSIRILCPLEPGTKLYRHAQPAPVAPEEMTPQQASRSYGGEVRGYRAGWNACRAAMLQELKKSAGTEAICRSDENVQVLHTKSPAQSDCCPAQNSATPAQNSATPAQGVNSLVIPDEMTSEQAYEIGYCYGDPVDVFARGANWMRQHIIDSTLAAAPQSPGSEPATVPGKWIPVSERMPENDGAYLCWDNRYVTTYAFIFGAWQANQFVAKNITHWMPLPAAPQEVNHG